jgi:predicted nucleic acid-binding protein
VRVLIDTNVLLDFLLQRELFFQDAERLFQAIDSGQIVGYVTATTLTDIFYIANNGLFRTLSIFKLLSEQGFSDGLS